jgi:hypothetical protein
VHPNHVAVPACPSCSKDEKRLLEARLAYKKGQPFMSDQEYDALKASLQGSPVFR